MTPDNARLRKITALSIKFYAEDHIILRYAGSTRTAGVTTENPRDVITIRAVVRADKNNLAENSQGNKINTNLHRVIGKIRIHSEEPLLPADEVGSSHADFIKINDDVYEVDFCDKSIVHGGFYKAYATLKRSMQ